MNSQDNDCRNHHWGPLFYLCQPEQTSILYYVESISATTEQNPHALVNAMDMGTDWDKYFYKQVVYMRLTFDSIGDTGWYKSEVKYEVSRYPLSANGFWAPVMLATVFGWIIISTRATHTLLMTPMTLFRLTQMFLASHIKKRRPDPDEVKVRMYDLFDYGGHRALGHGYFKGAKCSFVMILQENLAVYFFLLGVYMSIQGLFMDAYFPWETGDEDRPYLQEKCGREACSVKVFSAYELLTISNPVLKDEVASRREMMLMDPSITGGWNMRTVERATWQRKLAMWVRMLFYGPPAELFHTAGLFFSIIRLFEVFYHVPAWRWFPETLTLCAGQVFNFIVILNIIVAGFAGYFVGRFGKYFISFYSFKRAYLNLMFYVCNLYDPFQYHLHTYQEDRAYRLTVSLALFQVVVVIISLNFFTSIVMTAYGYATEESSDKRMWRLNTNEVFVWRQVFNFFGIPAHEQRQFVQSKFPGVEVSDSDDDGAEAGQAKDEKKPLLDDWKTETTSQRRKRESIQFQTDGDAQRSSMMDRVGQVGIKRASGIFPGKGKPTPKK
jgi:hypothetical protein